MWDELDSDGPEVGGVSIAGAPLDAASVVPIGRTVTDPLGHRLFLLRAVWIDGYLPRESALLALWRARPRTRFVAHFALGGKRWSGEVAVEGVQWERVQGPARIQVRSCGGISPVDAPPEAAPLASVPAGGHA